MPSPDSSCRRRRAASTVMMMSDISGISDIRRSIAGRGASSTVVFETARIGIDQMVDDMLANIDVNLGKAA